MKKKNPVYRTFIDTSFSAAHQLRGYEGSCGDLHGHTWTVRVEVEMYKLNNLGITIDFRDLEEKTVSLLEKFDHRCMNQISPFDKKNPTAENLASYVYHNVEEFLPDNAKIIQVIVWESENYGVKYSER